MKIILRNQERGFSCRELVQNHSSLKDTTSLSFRVDIFDNTVLVAYTCHSNQRHKIKFHSRILKFYQNWYRL